MKKLLQLSLIFSFIICISGCTENTEFDPEVEKSKIETVLEKYVIANETQDIELVHKVWAPREDIVVFGTAGDEKIVGWEEIKERLLTQFNSFEDTYISVSDQIIRINHTGNTAWFSEIINYNFIFKGSAVSYEGVRFTGVLEKIDDEWYIVQSHMSLPSQEEYK